MIKQLTTSQFNTIINQSITTLIAFTAPWCPPCRAMKPILEEFAKNNSHLAEFYFVNIDDDEALAIENGIEFVPTVLVFKNGERVAMANSPFSNEKLESLVNSE